MKKLLLTFVAAALAATSFAQSLSIVATDHEGTFETPAVDNTLNGSFQLSNGPINLFQYYFYLKNNSSQGGTVQVDSLFITAILTVVGFSVHDTIVVFDRIRENNRFLAKKYSSGEIINASVNQTLARSLNTSLTTLLTLLALYFFGGATTKDFVLAMILGIIAGTYSSIFFASVLLAWDKEIKAKKANAQNN